MSPHATLKEKTDAITGNLLTGSGTLPSRNNIAFANDDPGRRANDTPMSFRYPKYYKAIPEGMTELDIYALCMVFQVSDFSGALHHAIKKILLPGTRTGGKSRRDDIKEARDTLTRWLELNK